MYTAKLPFNFARDHGVIIEEINENKALIAYKQSMPPSLILLSELKRFLLQNLELHEVTDEKFNVLLVSLYEKGSDSARQVMADLGAEELDLYSLADEIPQAEELLENEDSAPIIRLINAILSQAIQQQASDIHIETYEEKLVVRFRIDGILRIILEPQRSLAPVVTSRIKVMAKLDIAEKRVPQDGRISLKIGGRDVDVRVSTMPTQFGERIVMRLLDKQAGRLDLASLGMSDTNLERMNKIIKKPYGIFLVTGPTGSGKSTSLYAVLTVLNQATNSILTVEDPIEYDLIGISQTQVNLKAKMTFAKALRAMLRQDPDIMMVGEIRDAETVEVSVQASLTGHLVLSTLHTNTAIGAITRLRDMGIEPFLLSSSLIGILAQRLVRVLCNDCKKLEIATAAEREILQIPADQEFKVYHAVGCDKCNNIGYIGRSGIYELVVVDEKLRDMIHNEANEHDMLQYIRKSTPGIRFDGIRKIQDGTTTVEEVMRVTSEDDKKNNN